MVRYLFTGSEKGLVANQEFLSNVKYFFAADGMAPDLLLWLSYTPHVIFLYHRYI
jgi:hypothetical protein